LNNKYYCSGSDKMCFQGAAVDFSPEHRVFRAEVSFQP
jgi:hypothetical protein